MTDDYASEMHAVDYAVLPQKRKRRRERYIVRDDAGASGETRTPDLLITNQLLYRLSYTSILKRISKRYINRQAGDCQSLFPDLPIS